ncbi:uncharacterized protein MYCFIDRAFT_211267 [Pseudocercospora fijiensis CIRAD86]|uniref:Uncharacterized protein n=1 Tax=Pseudocercospora fijiensis (strain CIRAD86) TaxID=383855 RepID=M3B1I3_PSEFD|nr:uncharacterized protein MYCFIDRAFT_211267 [Pseudocercospora fijiensis CIRAD86]EME83213.1 hypothetical protein MYCFIDRAFT_211267 [Pseudocercospora fijiensis CIRAD86]
MSTPWEDRRGMFQRGKEVHEPARRPSQSGGVIDAVRRASVSSQSSVTKSPSNGPAAAPASPTGQRRRSSTASQGLFGNLTQHKRGSEDYEARRASHTEQMMSGGVIGGWFNKTFRGVGKPADAQEPGKDSKRGVME